MTPLPNGITFFRWMLHIQEVISSAALFVQQVHIELPPRHVQHKEETVFIPWVSMGILAVFFALAISAAFVHRRIRRARLKREYQEHLAESLSLTEAQRQLLANSFPYYRQLSPENKLRFEQRVHQVMHKKHITVSLVDTSSWFVELVFASSLVQLTFGLPAFTLPHFKVIRILPDSFPLTPKGKATHQGLVSPTGVILLSWKHLKEGIKDPGDAFALGLHELAHALYIENFIPNSEDDFFSDRQLDRWKAVAEDTLEEVREGRQTLLRQYAGTNVDELFAVSVEYFFERPQALRQAHPDLFEALSSLLNQDPARGEDPVISLNEAMDW